MYFTKATPGKVARLFRGSLYEFLSRFHIGILPLLELLGTPREFHERDSGCSRRDGDVAEYHDKVGEIKDNDGEQHDRRGKSRPENAAAEYEPKGDDYLDESECVQEHHIRYDAVHPARE